MKRTVIAALLAWLSLTAAAQPAKNKNLTVSDFPTVAASKQSWKTETNKDQLTGKDFVSHAVDSDNTVNFGFPYQGAQRATITVLKHPKYGLQIRFDIQKGQLLCHDSDLSYGQCMVDIRLDDKAPKQVRMVKAADGDSTVLFIANGASFLKELFSSKQLIVSPVVFKQGQPAFTFQTAGLPAIK